MLSEKIARCMIFLLVISCLSFSAGKYQYIVNKYDTNIGSVPFVGGALSGETVKVIVSDGETFGFRTSQNGSVKEYSEQPYPDSSVALDITDHAAADLKNSPEPVNTFRHYWGSEIRYRGLNFFSTIKLFFYDLGYGIFNLFSPPKPLAIAATQAGEFPPDWFYGSGLVTCADTSPNAGGDVILLQEKPRPIRQMRNNTCVPNSLIWILEWLNRTHPGLVSGNRTVTFRNITSRLVMNENGTTTPSVPGGIARYLNATGKNSTIKVYGNWTLVNGTWVLGVGNETPMETKNSSVVAGGQNLSLQANTSYMQVLEKEFNESEGILILFDAHAVAGSGIIDKDSGTIEVMDPAQGALVSAIIYPDGTVEVYDPDGVVHRRGPLVAIIAISPDMLGR